VGVNPKRRGFKELTKGRKRAKVSPKFSAKGRASMSKNYEIEVSQIQQKIEELQKSIRIVTSPVELEALEKEIQVLVNELGNALLGQKLQESVESETMSEAEKALIADHPQRFKREKKRKMSPFGLDLAAR